MTPISGTSPIALTLPSSATTALAAKPGDFTQALNQALQQVSLKQTEASESARRFQLGDPGVSLEQTMLASQTANISFQALVQVRNRVVAAYQDIMNMPV